MTINANRATTRITAARTMLDNLHARLPRAIHAVTVGEHPGTDDKPKAEDAGIRGINWIGDPTAAAALTAAQRRDKHLDAVERQIGDMVKAIGLLTTFCDDWAPVAKSMPSRCSGGRSVEDWSRPECNDLVELYPDGRERAHGLCPTCRRRRDDWNRNQTTAA